MRPGCAHGAPRLRAWCAQATRTAPRQRALRPGCAHCAQGARTAPRVRALRPGSAHCAQAARTAPRLRALRSGRTRTAPRPRAHCAVSSPRTGRVVAQHWSCHSLWPAVSQECCAVSRACPAVSWPLPWPYYNPGCAISRHSQRPYLLPHCHDTIDCIMTRPQPDCPLVTIQRLYRDTIPPAASPLLSRYNTM